MSLLFSNDCEGSPLKYLTEHGKFQQEYSFEWKLKLGSEVNHLRSQASDMRGQVPCGVYLGTLRMKSPAVGMGEGIGIVSCREHGAGR